MNGSTKGRLESIELGDKDLQSKTLGVRWKPSLELVGENRPWVIFFN